MAYGDFDLKTAVAAGNVAVAVDDFGRVVLGREEGVAGADGIGAEHETGLPADAQQRLRDRVGDVVSFRNDD